MMGRREGPRAAGLAGWHASFRVFCVCLVALLTASVNSMTMYVDYGNEACVFITAKKDNTINANYEILGYPLRETMVILQQKEDGKLLYKKEAAGEDFFRVDATRDGDYELCFINGDTERIKHLSKKDIKDGTRLVGLDALRKKRSSGKGEDGKEKASTEYTSSFPLRPSFGESDDDDSFPEEDDFLVYYDKERRGGKTFGFGLRLGKDVEDLESMADVTDKEKAVARFMKDEADNLVQTLSVFNDHESYMRGREEHHRENVKQTSSRLMWCTIIEAAVLVWVSWSQLSYIRRFFETKRIL